MKKLYFFVFVLGFFTFACSSGSAKSAANTRAHQPLATNQTNTSVSSANNLEPAPIPGKEEIDQVVSKTKPVSDTWVEGARLVAGKSDINLAKDFLKVLTNQCYGRIIRYGGLPTTQVVSTPKNQQEAAVCFILYDEAVLKEMPELARQQGKEFAASYVSQSISINGLKEFATQNKLLKGLILMHEMVHWYQDMYGDIEKIPAPHREIQAYEFEFELLDQLKLPGYEQFISSEIKKPLTTTNPYLEDRRLDAMFGGNLTDIERKMIATIIYFRIAFIHFDNDPNGEGKKVGMIATIYKS